MTTTQKALLPTTPGSTSFAAAVVPICEGRRLRRPTDGKAALRGEGGTKKMLQTVFLCNKAISAEQSNIFMACHNVGKKGDDSLKS